jgi:glycosyltransferase involved in cell wall biosynthesis
MRTLPRVYRGRQVAVIVPSFNVESRVRATLRSIPDWIDRIVVVDDGSTDATAAHVSVIGRSGLELLRHEENRGVGAAIASGYRSALDRGADVLVVMAGDGQMAPSDLPALLDPVCEGEADYVKGNRFYDPLVWRRMPPARLLGNVLLSFATRMVVPAWRGFDSQCGYTAVRREVFQRIGTDLYRRYGYPNDLLARIGEAGLRVRDVPVQAVYDGAPSGVRWFTALRVGWVLARALLRRLSGSRARRGSEHLLPA